MSLLYKGTEKTADTEDFTDQGSFGSAFKAARSAGAAAFMWNNKKYTTKMGKSSSNKTNKKIIQPKKSYIGYGPVAEPAPTVENTTSTVMGPEEETKEIIEETKDTDTLKEVWSDMGHSDKDFTRFVNLLGVLGGAESGRGKKTSSTTSSAKGDFHITDDTFKGMKKRFFKYAKQKGYSGIQEIKEERPDLFKILTANSPTDLSRKEQASLIAVYMTQSDIPLYNFLSSKQGTETEKKASRDVYKYWVRDFNGAVYGDNQHIKNWDNNLRYLDKTEDNMKYMKYQSGGVTTRVDIAGMSKIPNLSPPPMKDKARLGKKPSPIMRGGLNTPTTDTIKNTSLDSSLNTKPIIKKQNDFNITGLFSDIFKGAKPSSFYDSTPNPL